MALKPMPPKISDAEYSKLTMSERIEYANSFSDEGRRVKVHDWELTPEERWRQ